MFRNDRRPYPGPDEPDRGRAFCNWIAKHAMGCLKSAVMPPISPPRHLSKTEIRVSKLVPCLAKAAPDTALVNTRWAVSVRRPKVSESDSKLTQQFQTHGI